MAGDKAGCGLMPVDQQHALDLARIALAKAIVVSQTTKDGSDALAKVDDALIAYTNAVLRAAGVEVRP